MSDEDPGDRSRTDEDPGESGDEYARGSLERGVDRRLHPLSVVYRGVTGSLNLGTLVFLGGLLVSGSISMDSLAFVGLLVVGIGVSLAYQVAYFYRFRYRVSDGSLDISSGVVSRRNREIPLRRIQNVDVGQNPLQRLLGIASVRIETAGGGQTEAELKYVGREEAARLREELRGRDLDTVGDEETAREPLEGETVFELPTRNLVLLSTFTIDRGAGVISSIVAAVMGTGDPTEMVGVGRYVSLLPGEGVQRVVSAVVLFVVAAWGLSFVITFARYYGFRLVRVGDQLEYERGLVQRYSGTIPMDKIQAVSVHENVLKRATGYATLSVETAGYSPGSDRAGGADAAIPLAERGRVVEIARSIEPFEAPAVERPPTRARLRYVVRYLVAVVTVAALVVGVGRFTGWFEPGPEFLALGLPLLVVPVAAHLKWRNLGHETQADHFVARAGFWKRSTRMVPYYRIQTVIDSRNVFQRRRNLADLTADTASSSSFIGGHATAFDVDDGRAGDLRGILRRRLQESLAERRTELRAERLAALRADLDGSSDPNQGRAGDADDDPGDPDADPDEPGDDRGDPDADPRDPDADPGDAVGVDAGDDATRSGEPGGAGDAGSPDGEGRGSGDGEPGSDGG